MSANRPRLLLHGARLVLPDQVIERGAILVADGKIQEIYPGEAPLTADDEAVDLSGLTLFPGFIDVHIHGAVGVDTLAATAADLGRVSHFLATQGVTAWLPTLVPASVETYGLAIAAIAESIQLQADDQNATGARVLGVHYEGPFVNTIQCGALHTDFFRSFSGNVDLDDLPQLHSPGSRHLMTLAPEIAGGIELIAELGRRDWTVSIGHTLAEFAVLNKAFAAGARHMTHFMNAMAPLHHRSPGPVAWGLAQEDVTCDLIADGIHLHPEMLRLLLKLKGSDRLLLISDAIAAAGLGDGDYEIWGETISVRNGRTSNARGSIAGSVITVLDAVRLMISLGASAGDVALMAAANPARLLGIHDDCGSIEKGKRADLVALDQDLNVRLTFVSGRLHKQ